MLKLTYSELGIYAERLPESLEAVAARRTLLAMRAGQAIHLEPSFASLLVPADIPELRAFQSAAAAAPPGEVCLGTVNVNCVEITLRGYWLASSTDAEEGLFLSALEANLETHLVLLWQAVSRYVSSVA